MVDVCAGVLNVVVRALSLLVVTKMYFDEAGSVSYVDCVVELLLYSALWCPWTDSKVRASLH